MLLTLPPSDRRFHRHVDPVRPRLFRHFLSFDSSSTLPNVRRSVGRRLAEGVRAARRTFVECKCGRIRRRVRRGLEPARADAGSPGTVPLCVRNAACVLAIRPGRVRPRFLPRRRILTGLAIPAASGDGDESLLRYSPAKALDLLRSKVDALANPDGGIFGPLESTEPGEDRKPLADAALDGAASAFSSAKRGLGKEDVGSGHGLSAEIQTGEQACDFLCAPSGRLGRGPVSIRIVIGLLRIILYELAESRQKYAIGIIANYLPPVVTKQLLAAYECVSRSPPHSSLCMLLICCSRSHRRAASPR